MTDTNDRRCTNSTLRRKLYPFDTCFCDKLIGGEHRSFHLDGSTR